MVEIKNNFVCACIDLDISEAIIKEFFRDFLKKVPNAMNSDDFSDVLATYLKKVQSRKLEDLDNSTKSRMSLARDIIQYNLDKDNVYILDKNTWEETNTVLILEINSCSNEKANIALDLRTTKDQFGSEDFELSYKPLNILINNSIRKINGVCCRFYYITDSNSLLIQPNNWSFTPPSDLVSKLGDFKIYEFKLNCEKSELGISRIGVEKLKSKIKVSVMTKLTSDLSVDLLQKLAKHNFEGLMSLLISKK